MTINRISPELGKAEIVHNKTLLFVDDEPNVLSSLQRLFRRENFRVITASSGAEALEFLQAAAVPVIISDERMPDMSGTKFLQTVKQQFPETITCILSGYADNSNIMQSMIRGDVFRFLPKPWQDEELKLVIQQCFALHSLVTENRHFANKISVQNEMISSFEENFQKILDDRAQGFTLAHTILDLYPHATIALDTKGCVAYLNKECDFLLGDAEETIKGKHYTDVLPIELTDFVDYCTSNSCSNRLVLQIYGQSYDVLVLRLISNGQYRGLCVQLEQIYNLRH